jgi:hypothetical protein
MTLRQRFELWAADTFGADALARNSSSYEDLRVHGAWIAWQYLATSPDTST